jgi:CheY-like chemotaxis protein
MARAAAEEASRAKDRFMAMLSHELRTPLTPAMALLGEMLADERLPEEVRQDVAVARRNVELEVRLIDDLLDLTRIQNGKLEMRPRWVDVHEVVREAVRMVAPDVTAKRQRLGTTFAAGKSNVRADAERLQQVLWNLLRNAVKFTPEGGSVNVVTENTAGGGIRVTVSDTGIGIAADVLPRLFKPFEQGRPTITRVFGGLGLGLAISQSIVRMHSGMLEAASDGPGKGSAFTFELPVAVAAVPKAEAAAPARAPQADGGRRLLLVEDHADTARVMGRLLKAKGYDVTTATSVKGGVDAAERARFDIVVSDVGLPDGSGLDLMRLLRQRYGLRGIALTGFGQESDVVAAKAAGFDAHLTKPIDVNRLLGLLEQIQGSARGGG